MSLSEGWLYSPLNLQAEEKFITESLAASIIWLSLSLLDKKDKSLHSCIDYPGLNNITVKNRYPLPLIYSAFKLLQGASAFCKIDLRNAYHLVSIRKWDEWKTAFNKPSIHYE